MTHADSGPHERMVHRMTTSRVFATLTDPSTPGSSTTAPSPSTFAWRHPEELMSSILCLDSSVARDASTTHSRRNSGRDLVFSRCRFSSRVSCSTMHKFVPFGARTRNCGLSGKEVCIRSPPEVVSPHSPETACPQKRKDSEPGSTCDSSLLRSIDEVNARAIDANRSNRMVAYCGCRSTAARLAGTSDTRLTSASAASSEMVTSCSRSCAKSSCEYTSTALYCWRSACIPVLFWVIRPKSCRVSLITNGSVDGVRSASSMGTPPASRSALLKGSKSCASSDKASTVTRCSLCRGTWARQHSCSTCSTCEEIPCSKKAERFEMESCATAAMARHACSLSSGSDERSSVSKYLKRTWPSKSEPEAYSWKMIRASASITHGNVRATCVA
mmetsp:Transcript_34308/g.83371  ORF Transcript_34308/g.83371 Transcript_34308/m.83371 type:complete len:387 (-) Transcript_34308:1038-2198(-)